MFPRHQPIPEPVKYAATQRNTCPINLTVEIPSVSDLTGTTNAAVDTVNFRGTNSSSVVYSNGYLTSSTVTNSINFGFFAWVRPTVSSYALWSIDDKFGFIVESNILKIKRQIYSGQYEVINTGLSIAVSTWNLVRIYRDDETLYIKVGSNTVTLVFNYKIQSGTFLFGKLDTATFTGNAFNIGYWSDLQYSQYLFFNADGSVFDELFSDELVEKNALCNLKNVDYLGNFTFTTNTATYSVKDKRYEVTPNSLAVKSDGQPSSDFTCSLIFSVPSITDSVEFFSHWISPQLSFAFIQAGGQLRLALLNPTPVTVTIGTLVVGQKHILTVQFRQRNIIVWLDGKQVYNSTITNFVKLPSYRFFFNSSNYLTPINSFYLYEFKVVDNLTNLTNFLPDIEPTQEKVIQPYFRPIRYRNFWQKHPNISIKSFSVTGLASVTPNSTTTYTITQNERLPYSVNYQMSILLPANTDWLSSEISLPASTVSVAPNGNSATFQLILSNFAVNKARQSFTIRVFGLNFYQDFTVSLNDTRPYTLSAATNLSGYVDGYFATSSTISGVVPNLTATANATTTSALLNTDIYGKAYNIDVEAEKIVLPATLTNIRTIFYVYRELNSVASRKYVGNSTGYTFNGGTSGELIGSLVFNPGDFVSIGTLTGRFFTLALSADENYLVYMDDLLNTVKVVRKNGGVWDFSTPTTLTLTSLDASNLPNADIKISANGTQILIGLKNSGTVAGEGRVLQFTRSGTNTWTNSLTLGSPLPLTFLSGFGLAVSQNTADTKLVISEQNSNIYVFQKSGLTYNTTPIQTINYFAKKIVGLDDLSSFLALDDLGNARLYTDSSGYTLSHTFSADLDISYQPNYIALSKIGGTVEIWQFTGAWTLIKTIVVPTTNFGYSLKITSTQELIVGSPNEGKIYLYSPSDTWTTPKIFTGSTGFGYVVTGSTNVVAGSTYTTTLQVYSKDGSSVPQNIISVRQNKQAVFNDTALDTTDVSILQFTSNTNLDVSSIGDKINGLWLGALFFDRYLTNQEIIDIETNIYKFLSLKERSLYV